MTGPTVPRCCVEHHAEVLEVILAMIANDAAAEVVELVADGHDPNDAASLTETCLRREILKPVEDAILLGIGWAHAAEQPAL